MKKATKNIVLTKSGKVNKNISNAIRNCSFDGNKIRTGYYSGFGRFTSRHSAMGNITPILESQGYKYSIGNDSHRGGASGEYIKVSKQAMNFIISLLN